MPAGAVGMAPGDGSALGAVCQAGLYWVSLLCIHLRTLWFGCILGFAVQGTKLIFIVHAV